MLISNVINKISNCKAIESYSVLKFINLKLRNTKKIDNNADVSKNNKVFPEFFYQIVLHKNLITCQNS